MASISVRDRPQTCNAMTVPVPQPAMSGNDDRDRDLLRRIGWADREAFEQLYHDYYKRLARFLGRVTPHREEVEAVINDALFMVWEHACDFRDASRASTWIFGIAYRCALKSMRRSAVRPRAAAHELQCGEADAAGQTGEARLLDFALLNLPLEQRLVLVLAYYMSCACEEIAAIAECPVNTVKAQMSQARHRLRSLVSAAPPCARVDADGRARPESCALLDQYSSQSAYSGR
jgi:RNA polymerase sigma-70 factor, ECF subfamily